MSKQCVFFNPDETKKMIMNMRCDHTPEGRRILCDGTDCWEGNGMSARLIETRMKNYPSSVLSWSHDGESGRVLWVPLDGHDFASCVKLIRLHPEWRANLWEMKMYPRHHPRWSWIVDHWDQLEQLHDLIWDNPQIPQQKEQKDQAYHLLGHNLASIPYRLPLFSLGSLERVTEGSTEDDLQAANFDLGLDSPWVLEAEDDWYGAFFPASTNINKFYLDEIPICMGVGTFKLKPDGEEEMAPLKKRCSEANEMAMKHLSLYRLRDCDPSSSKILYVDVYFVHGGDEHLVSQALIRAPPPDHSFWEESSTQKIHWVVSPPLEPGVWYEEGVLNA